MGVDPVPLVGVRDVEPRGHWTDLRRAVAHGTQARSAPAREPT
jgi:hypothetical protein